MKKVHSLFAMLILLGISTLSACRHHPEGHHPATPQTAGLKILINGPVAIVLKKSDPSKIIVFTPRDDMHEIYINDVATSQDRTKNYHFKLLPDGLKTASVAPRIDQYLADFTAETDVWKSEDYFVTIELPAPDTITFAPPLKWVNFENGGGGYMSTNYILEYRVTDPGKIRVVSPELSTTRPIFSAELQKQYADFCSSPAGSGFHDSCIEMRNLLANNAGANTRVFFFGIGVPVPKHSAMSMSAREVPNSQRGWVMPSQARRTVGRSGVENPALMLFSRLPAT